MHSWSGIAFAVVIAVGIAPTAVPGTAQADQKFPARPVRLVVPFSPGGTPDILARMLGQKMSENWRQPVVVDNRTGAGGTLGAAIVARAAPDGHTLLLTSSAFAIGAALGRKLPYDPLIDFAAIADIGASTMVLVVAPALGVASAKDFIAVAQANPGKFLFGSAGAGSATHMHAERFRYLAGIKAQHVGFKGQPEFLIEIAAARVHFGVSALTVCLPLVRDGRLVPLAVGTPERSPLLPEVPAMAEVVRGWSREGGIRLLAPAGTAVPVLRQVSKEVAETLDFPEIRTRLQAVGFQISPTTPEESGKSLRADIEAFTRIAKAAGLRAP
jgi:tripartite-type tricarboxylate transporter receptor subunit TctC